MSRPASRVRELVSLLRPSEASKLIEFTKDAVLEALLERAPRKVELQRPEAALELWLEKELGLSVEACKTAASCDLDAMEAWMLSLVYKVESERRGIKNGGSSGGGGGAAVDGGGEAATFAAMIAAGGVSSTADQRRVTSGRHGGQRPPTGAGGGGRGLLLRWASGGWRLAVANGTAEHLRRNAAEHDGARALLHHLLRGTRRPFGHGVGGEERRERGERMGEM